MKLQDRSEDMLRLLDDERMLVAAGVLPEDERAYYRSRPEKWKGEIAMCRMWERLMLANGADPSEAWDMTAGEIVRAGIRREIRSVVERERVRK